MKYTTVHFPQDLLVSQGVISAQSNMWMLVRRWRVLARRILLVAIPLTFIYTTAALLLVLLPVIRIPSLQSTPYILISLEQVAWVCTLAIIFYVYCKRRQWLPGVVVILFILLLIKGVALTALHLESIWCARPNFGNEYVFTIPFDVVCENGTCTLNVLESEKPEMCATMHEFFHEMGVNVKKPRVMAGVLLGQHVIQTLLGLIIMVHALEDQVRLSY